jgi:hypothetical protein
MINHLSHHWTLYSVGLGKFIKYTTVKSMIPCPTRLDTGNDFVGYY